MVTIPTSKNESCKKLNINCHSIFAAFVLLLFYKWDKNTFFFVEKRSQWKSKKSLAKEDCALQGVQFENYQKCKSYSTEMGHFWHCIGRAKMSLRSSTAVELNFAVVYLQFLSALKHVLALSTWGRNALFQSYSLILLKNVKWNTLYPDSWRNQPNYKIVKSTIYENPFLTTSHVLITIFVCENLTIIIRFYLETHRNYYYYQLLLPWVFALLKFRRIFFCWESNPHVTFVWVLFSPSSIDEITIVDVLPYLVYVFKTLHFIVFRQIHESWKTQ